MNDQENADALRILAQMWRWYYDVNYMRPAPLKKRLYAIWSDLGINDTDSQNHLIAACVGRHIDNVDDLFGGEIKALIEESDLKSIIQYHRSML